MPSPLREEWHSLDGDAIESCSIITTAANELVVPAHECMPVALPSSAFDR